MIRPLVRLASRELVASNAPPDSILGRPCREVVLFDSALHAVIADLVETLFAHPIAIGLAAPQIGVDLCVAVVNVEREDPGASLIIVNPHIQSTSGAKDSKRESCMSLPGLVGTVMRRSKIHLEFMDADGNRKGTSFEGFLARVVQHEVDHLAGTLYSAHVDGGASALEPTDIFDYPDPLESI
jgi:peptide deformylase